MRNSLRNRLTTDELVYTLGEHGCCETDHYTIAGIIIDDALAAKLPPLF